MQNQDLSEEDSQKNVVLLVYLLQGLAFFVGITYLIAIIINYVKRDDAKGTWLESHFKWQIRTFWFSILWFAIGTLTLMLYVGGMILLINLIWVIYRIIKGWLRLNDRKPMYE
jgi:uncharacterized membrane protein